MPGFQLDAPGSSGRLAPLLIVPRETDYAG